MSMMYLILAVAGWVWLAVVLLVLGPAVVRRRRERPLRGMEVVERHENQS